MYPLEVTTWTPVRPTGRATNISATITPPSIQHYDYWDGLSNTFGTQLRVLNTDAHPWWLAAPGEDDVLGPFSSAFSSAFRVVS